jgi:hypothetical protein
MKCKAAHFEPPYYVGPDFLLDVMSLYSCCHQISIPELRHVFKGSLYIVIIVPHIILTRHEHLLGFPLRFISDQLR